MKKFISLICAIAIVLGANAAPQIKVAKQKSALLKEITKQKADKNVKDAKSVPFKSMSVKGVKKSVAKAPQAKAETVSLNFDSDIDAVKFNDNSADYGWWQATANNGEYYVSLSNGDSRTTAAGSYTWDQMDADYTFIANMETGEKIIFTAGSVSVTIEEDGKIVISASLTGEDGNTYNISITSKPVILPEGGNFEMVDMTEEFYSADNDIYIKLYDADGNSFSFDIVVPAGESTLTSGKEYTLADMLEDESKANYAGVTFGYKSATFKKTDKEDGSAEIVASFVDESDNVWNLHYTKPAPPTAKSFETITAEVTYVAEPFFLWTEYIFKAADEVNSIEFSLMPDATFYGTWAAGENKDITGAVTPLNGLASDIYSGEVVIAKSESGFTITGTVLCENSVEYTLQLTYTNPEPTRDEVLMIEGLELYIYNGAWQLAGYNADSTAFVSIAAYTDEIAGNYTDADLVSDYSYIITDIVWGEDGKPTSDKEYSMISANLTVQYAAEDSTIVIDGEYLGQYEEDIPKFTVLLKGRIPASEPAKAMSVSFSMKDMDATVKEEYWELKGAEPELGYYLGIRSLSGAEIAGNYTEADLDSYWTYVGAGDDVFFDMSKAAITVSYEEGVIAITGEVTFVDAESKDTIYATLDVAGFYDGKEHPEYDEKGEDFIYNFEEVKIDNSAIAQYGICAVQATGETNEIITLYFFVGTQATGLTPGEYAVNSSHEAGSVWAGEGLDSEGYITGSFAGIIGSQGITNIWWIVSGKVTVEESGVIVVDALNSYDKLIKCQLGKSSEEAVENTAANAKAVKRLENNTLIIEKNGVQYNVLGAELK